MPMTLGGAANGTSTGPLAPALAVSIALHAAVLAGLPDLWTFSDPPTPSALTAWLAPGVQPANAPDSAPVEAPKRESADLRRPPSVVAPKAALPAHRAPIPEPDTAAQLNRPRVSEAVAGERVDVAAVSPSASALKVDAAPSAPSDSSAALAGPGGASPDLGSLAQYRLALIGAAKRHKTYPPRAIDRGLEGRVDVRLVIGTDGGLARVLVRRSSGHDVLDREALELMRTASALTPVPPALRNREFAVEVPVLYELKDER